MKRSRRSGPTFANLVHSDDNASESAHESYDIPNPLRDGFWIDGEGTRWHRRGEQPTRGRVERLLADASVRVLVFGEREPNEIAPDDRTAWWAGVRPYYPARPSGAWGQAEPYAVGEFKCEGGKSLLAVYVSC